MSDADGRLGSWELERVKIMVGFYLSPDPKLVTAFFPWTPDSL